MLSDEIRQQLQHIIRGAIIEGQVDTCTAIRNQLCAGFGTGRTVKKDFESQSRIKEKQVIVKRKFFFTNPGGFCSFCRKYIFKQIKARSRINKDFISAG